ncbi:DUF4291 family protein [Bradyrhizobium sp.]|uniref:DUF4291 family protein n=1 Tax=Bradyrhizobium sp. TaxID=376 RepID=UPI00345590FF
MIRRGASTVRIQWDPERDLRLQPLPYRTIQLGIGPDAVTQYIGQWIRKITDLIDLAHAVYRRVQHGELKEAEAMLPKERPYESVMLLR